MVSKGAEYERFVYEKAKRLFVNSRVVLNDQIFGRQSKLMREIDISISIDLGEEQLLYIVQCKDRTKRPADIIILGEFSSVIQDVGAAKGFLVCTSGFARSNYDYAKTLGIELLTVEDINSDRWKAHIEIPLVYVRKDFQYRLNVGFIVNEEFVALNRDRDITFTFDIQSMVSLNNGETAMTVQDYFEKIWLAEHGNDALEGVDLDILHPDLRVNIAGIWLVCNKLTINVVTKKRFFLKYLTPDEYSQVSDHRRRITIPLHLSISGPAKLDDSFVEMPYEELPINPVLSFQLEQWTPLERAQGRGPFDQQVSD
jgi:Restriction endonuclease